MLDSCCFPFRATIHFSDVLVILIRPCHIPSIHSVSRLPALLLECCNETHFLSPVTCKPTAAGLALIHALLSTHIKTISALVRAFRSIKTEAYELYGRV